jgi:hypothetical protein
MDTLAPGSPRGGPGACSCRWRHRARCWLGLRHRSFTALHTRLNQVFRKVVEVHRLLVERTSIDGIHQSRDLRIILLWDGSDKYDLQIRPPLSTQVARKLKAIHATSAQVEEYRIGRSSTEQCLQLLRITRASNIVSILAEPVCDQLRELHIGIDHYDSHPTAPSRHDNEIPDEFQTPRR